MPSSAIMALVRPYSPGGKSIDGESFRMGDLGSKRVNISTESLTRYSTTDGNDVEGAGRKPVVANMEDMALKALHVDDDPSLNPWTFRMFVLGKKYHLYAVWPRASTNAAIQDWGYPHSDRLSRLFSCSSRSQSRSRSSS